MHAHSPVKHVVGRFAPSPTGPLHFGSLVAAVASYCAARSQNGRWLLRIEDVDQTRCHPAISQDIIRCLQQFGFVWDGEVTYQHQRTEAYQRVLDQLIAQGMAYPCTCSRKEISDSSQQQGIEGAIYPGTCLRKPCKTGVPSAWRLRTPAAVVTIDDSIQGQVSHHLAHEIGDFVLKRADGLFSYQLAVVVDDAWQGVTQVVRGADLLHSSTRQRYLQQLLGWHPPSYSHLPMAVDAQWQKLSKQNLAAAIDADQKTAWLKLALRFLGQATPDAMVNDVLDWACCHWQPELIPRLRQLPVPIHF